MHRCIDLYKKIHFNFALNFFIYRLKKRWGQGMILLDDSHSGNWTVNNLYYSIKILIAKRNKLYKYNNDHLIRLLWCLYFELFLKEAPIWRHDKNLLFLRSIRAVCNYGAGIRGTSLFRQFSLQSSRNYVNTLDFRKTWRKL